MPSSKLKIGSIICPISPEALYGQGIILETDWKTGIANVYWFKTKLMNWNYFGTLKILVP